MTQFKSMIYLLVFLIVLQPALQGCTVTGYSLGRNADIHSAGTLKNSNLDEIRKGTFVDVILVNGKVIRGKVRHIIPNQEICIKDINANRSQKDYQRIKTFKWDEISEIKKVNIHNGYRVSGLLFGLILDFCLFLLVVSSVATTGLS